MGHSVLPKSSSAARLQENLDVFDWSIPEDLFVKFSDIPQASSFLFLFSINASNFRFSFLVLFGLPSS